MALSWQLESNVDQAVGELERVARERELEIAELIAGHIAEQMRAPKSGRTYKVPGTGVTYTASAAGEYPAVKTGRLVESIRAVAAGDQAVVGTNHPSAEVVEQLRPFLARASAELYDQIKAILERPWL